jgi:membrane protein DedA with SNARE-associated domain
MNRWGSAWGSVGITEFITEWATGILSALGYPGLVFLMALESMIAPIPSEAVMPFAGFLVVQGQFTLGGAIAASSLGTMIGSWLSYWMGLYGGYPLIERWGKYLLLDKEHLELTRRWFERRGELTIFVSRFIPVVRHFISIPAGVARMNPWKFSIYTLIGGTAWNTILLVVGMKLKERWTTVQHYSHLVDVVVVIGILISGAWFLRRQWHQRQRASS